MPFSGLFCDAHRHVLVVCFDTIRPLVCRLTCKVQFIMRTM